MLGHYLNQWQLIVHWTLKNCSKFLNHIIHNNTFHKMHFKMSPARRCWQFCPSLKMCIGSMVICIAKFYCNLRCHNTRASIHSTVRRLTTRSREVSKPRDWILYWSYRFEIWQASRQRCCRDACQISERLEKSKPKVSRLQNFTRSCTKTSYRLVIRGPEVECYSHPCHLYNSSEQR